MKNKGFTLVELLVSIVIISLLSGVGIISYQSLFKTSEERYYDALESSILLAANDYFEDHRDNLPTGSNYSEVLLSDLIDNKYMESVTDTNGNVCRNGSVFAYRENSKFKYEVCIVDCGGYSSTGRYCSNKVSREITVSAKTKTTNKSYDVTKSYNSVDYIKNENVLVTLGMNEEFSITKYIVRDTKDNSEIECNTNGDNTCTVEINKSGTYKVESYENDEEISSRYINVKIARNGSNFTLNTSDGQRKYLISQNECSLNKKTKNIIINVIKGVSKEEYKTVEYRINGGSYVEIDDLSIELTLESGHYDIDVVVTNYNDNVSVETISIDVSYLLKIEYDDDTVDTHEVVKGQIYNYLSNMPTKKNGNDITWHKGTTEINPNEDLVNEKCTYTITGETYVKYTITYNLNGGTNANSNPEIYTEKTESFTLANPTKSGSAFLGWTGSNDINANLTSYTMASPYVAGARDNYTGNDISLVSGNTYRIFVVAKKTAGTLKFQGGFWYTEKTSGTAYEGYNVGDFIEIESLGNGWARYYKDVTVPEGKTKGKIYFQIEQFVEAYNTTWQIADMHVVLTTSTASIPKGSTGNKVYNAYWKASHTLTLNLDGGTYSGVTTSISQNSGTTHIIGNNPTKAGYMFTGWMLSGGGRYDVYDKTVTPTETKTFNYNSASSTVPSVYNNGTSGTVTAAMVADSTASGGYSLKITTNGAASPGAGGVWLNVFPLTPGRINVLEVRAKIPTGYTLLDGGNGTLYRGMGEYIDSTRNVAATDRWQTFYLYFYTGNAGEISSTVYLHVSGSNNTSVTWYINSITMKSYTRDQFKSIYTFGGSDATLTAKWTIGGVGVTFNTNGGAFNTTYVKSWNNGYYNASATSALRHYNYNESVVSYPANSPYNFTPDTRVISRSGYVFDGWYTAASGGTKIFNADGSLVPSVSGYSDSSKKWIKYDSNVTLYAHWASNSYTVTYDSNLGQMDVWGTSYKDRWTRTYDSATGLYNISCAGASGWELLYLPINTTANHIYRVTFDYQIPTAYTALSGYSGIGFQTVNSLVNSNMPSALATAYLPTAVTAKTSQTLIFNATSAVTYFVLNFGMAADGVTTTIKVGNVKVYDDTSGTSVFAPSPATQTKASGGQYGTLPTVSRSGYTFNGWYTAPSGGTKIETTTTYTAAGNQTLYAHWTMGAYTQTYRSNGGNSGNSASETIGYWDVWVSKATNTYNKAGYTFNCWQSSTSTSCYGGGGWYYSSAGVGSSRYLDAAWTANNYTLTLDANGGSVSPTTKAVTYGNTYTDLPTPTRTGYSFRGWYGSYNGSSTFVNYGRAYMYTNKLSVHFSAYMSNWANYTRAISCTETGGWNIEPSTSALAMACYDSGSGYKNAVYNAAPSTLSAGWHDFDMIFNGTNAKLYIDGTLRGTSANYSSGKIGYNATNSIFLGGEATGSNSAASSPFFNGYIGNVVIKNTDAITSSSTYNTITAPAQSQTLYAKWVPNTYKVTLNNQSATTAGTTEVWYQYNTTRSVNGVTCYYYSNSSLSTCLANGYTISVPTKSGYKFDGYYTSTNGGGTRYINESGTFVNNLYANQAGDITLYAKWVAKTTPTLTISATSGTVVKGKTMTYTIKSNVAGTFTNSSNATGKATVSPATQSAAANTAYTVTVTGVADGSATITSSFTPSDTANYNTASKTFAATIMKSATIPTTSYCKSLTYNGSSQTLVNTAGTGYTWTAGTTRTDAGSQNVTATLSSGYRWSDNGTGTKTISCSIGQATPTFTKTESSKSIYNNRSDTYGLIPNVAGKITSSTSNSGVATVSQASNCSSIGANAQCVITVTGKSVGSATMTHTFTPTSSNYKSVSTTMPVTIKNSTFTVTFAGVNPISTSFDSQTVTLAGNVGVPISVSSTLALATNTNYVVSFDYKCASGSNQFDVDFFPDSLPQTNPTATTTLQHMDWITSSSNSAMGSAQLRFFDDFQGSGETDITITNIMLSRTSTKSVNYGSTYGDLPAPTRSGYTFQGWYTASNGGTQITSSSTVSTASNHTLYARWSKTTCCPSGGWYNGGYCYNTPHDMTERECSGHGYYMISGRCYEKRSGAHC